MHTILISPMRTRAACALFAFLTYSASNAIAAPVAPVDSTPPSKRLVYVGVTPILGLNAATISNTTGEHASVLWHTQLGMLLTIDGDYMQFFSSFLAQYGELSTESTVPSPTQNNLMLTLRPSIQISPAFKLFLDVTGQTQVAPGMIDDQPTNFLDPLFVYESICIGQVVNSNSADGGFHVDCTYGAGYALQETYVKNFILTGNRAFVIDPNDPNNLLKPVQTELNFDNGIIGMLNVNLRDKLADNLYLTTSLSAYGVTKKDLLAIDNTRAAGLVTFGLHYTFFGIDYLGHVIYDKNYSDRRNLQQTLLFTFQTTIPQ